MGFPDGSLRIHQQCWRPGFNPWVGKIGGHGNLLLYSCLENPRGQRSLEGYSPWSHKESDTTEGLTLSLKISLAFWSPNSNDQLFVWLHALQKPGIKLILLRGLRRKENLPQGKDEEFTQANTSEGMWVLTWLGTILRSDITYLLSFDFFSKEIETAVHLTSFWKARTNEHDHLLFYLLISPFCLLHTV